MNNSDLESFVHLRFYPPAATDEYINSVPLPVRETLFNCSNLKNNPRYTPTSALKISIEAYYLQNPVNADLAEAFWHFFKNILIEYYSDHG